MKLYHYLPKENNAREVGILTLSQKPEEIRKYGKRLGTEDIGRITAWLKQTFPGRTRAISVLTEPVQTKGTDPMLKEWVTTKELVSIDFNRLLADGRIESIWCKKCSDANGKEEKLYQISPDKIDLSPLPWEKCSKEKGLFFGVIRHYLIVLKDGVIPSKYLKFPIKKHLKLYHYVKKGSNVMQEGLLSFAKSPYVDINFYKKRSGQKTKSGIIKWMESCFKGRSRGIRFFTSPLKWTSKSLMIKKLVDECDLLEIDIEALEKDDLIEKVFFKPSVFDKKYQPSKDFKWLDEYLVPLNSIYDIDFKYRQTWNKCDDSKGLRMGPLRFHLLVIKDGVIPPKYIRLKN